MEFTFLQVQDLVIADLYLKHQSNDETRGIEVTSGVLQMFPTVDELEAEYDKGNKSIISTHEKAIKELIRLGYIEETSHSIETNPVKRHGDHSNREYEISAKGMKYVERGVNNNNSIVCTKFDNFRNKLLPVAPKSKDHVKSSTNISRTYSASNPPVENTPWELFKGFEISQAQFNDLMIIALSEADADGSGEAPWDIKSTADRRKLRYEPQWIDEFVHRMENNASGLISTDIKSSNYDSSRICAYANEAIFEAAPFLREKYFGYFTLKDYPSNISGRGLQGNHFSLPVSNRNAPLTESQENQVRELIRKAKEELPKLGLSNDEHSQVMAQLDAADTLATAPRPLWDRVKDILVPLAAIAGIGSFIASIIQIIG